MRGPDVQHGGVTLLTSPGGGRYPSGNSLLISGTEGTVLVDPSSRSTGEVDRARTSSSSPHPCSRGPRRGLHLIPEVPVVVHPVDVAAVRDPETLLSASGMAAAEADVFRQQLRETVHMSGHGRVDTVDDGAVFGLGRRSVTVVHLPGHTAGHCGLLVEPDGFLFLGVIDLTSFGPYYGDLSSSLDDFVTPIERLRDMDARWYGTFHHVGVLDDRQLFSMP